jgi:hypothetical protein
MTLHLCALVLTAAVALTGCYSLREECTDLAYCPQKVLYLKDKRVFTADDAAAVFEEIMAQNKPIILFLHGRGDEPYKSLVGKFFVEGRAVHKLEDIYKVPVIMFSWDSARSDEFWGLNLWDRSRPLSNINAAVKRFRTVIEKLEPLAALRDRKPFVLLAHSMGTIVLQSYVREHGHFPPGLFANVVLSSADADNKDHDAWVQPLTRTSRVYVTVNAGDDTLFYAWSCRDWGVEALGLNPGSALARDANYVPFEPMAAHEIFYRTPSERESSDPVFSFYDTVLKGGAYTVRPSPSRRRRRASGRS